MTRDELVALRSKLLRGDPPYVVKDTFVTGVHRKQRPQPGMTASGGQTVHVTAGTVGLEELRDLGDYDPSVGFQRLLAEVVLAILEDMLEKVERKRS